LQALVTSLRDQNTSDTLPGSEYWTIIEQYKDNYWTLIEQWCWMKVYWNEHFRVLWRYLHPQNDHVTLRPKRSSPMDRHRAPPISGSWSPGAARAVDGASLLHGPLRVDRTAETENKLNGWTDRAWTQRQGTHFGLNIWLNKKMKTEVSQNAGTQ
jgi:hypothetical protein